MARVRFSMIVAVCNGASLLENFLYTLQRYFPDDGELILVADGVTELDTLRLLKECTQSVRFQCRLETIKELAGYAKANNIGVSVAEGEYLVFINTDILITSATLSNLVQIVEQDENIGFAQSLLLYPQTMLVQSCGHTFGDYHNRHLFRGRTLESLSFVHSHSRQALTSALYCTRKKLFHDLGGFDEFYFNCYEGMELSLKATTRGLNCIVCPDSIAFHIQGSTRTALNLNESQFTGYFWSKWGKIIEADLTDYLNWQIEDRMRSETYVVVDFTRDSGWEKRLADLGFSSVSWYHQSLGIGSCELHQSLSPSLHNYPKAIIFISDFFRDLCGNQKWFKDRQNSNDLFLDNHGNLLRVMDVYS